MSCYVAKRLELRMSAIELASALALYFRVLRARGDYSLDGVVFPDPERPFSFSLDACSGGRAPRRRRNRVERSF